MAKIQVSDRIRLKSDAYCWRVERCYGIDKDGKERWDGFLYYLTLAGALKGLAGLKLRLSDAEGLAELERENARIIGELTAALERSPFGEFVSPAGAGRDSSENGTKEKPQGEKNDCHAG